MTRGLSRTSAGAPSAMTFPVSRQYTRSLMPMMSGMSCSMRSTEASSCRRTVTMRGPKASVSRCASPAVGSSRQRTLASSASSPASSTTRRVPVERSAM